MLSNGEAGRLCSEIIWFWNIVTASVARQRISALGTTRKGAFWNYFSLKLR